jgi:hypothetical protein
LEKKKERAQKNEGEEHKKKIKSQFSRLGLGCAPFDVEREICDLGEFDALPNETFFAGKIIWKKHDILSHPDEPAPMLCKKTVCLKFIRHLCEWVVDIQ